MPKRNPIRRGAVGRGLSLSLAGARAGGAFALDAAVNRLRGGDAADSPRLAREARRFASRLGELKGSYVKIGQMFALLGEHFLPAALTDALHELEADTRPLDWRHIEPLIEAALGERMSDLEINPEALGAASLAQVHGALVLDTDQQLVLKVQYPDLRDVIDDDFDAVVKMLRLARWLPAGRDFDSWLEGMRAQLHLEIDYRREAAMAAEMVALEKQQPLNGSRLVPLCIPTYHAAYSGDDVLAIEYIEGVPVTDASVAALPQSIRNRLGRTMLALFLSEVFDWGVMQTDPNFGNYLITPGGKSLALLDFGSVVALEPRFREGLAAVILGGQQRDEARVLHGLELLGCLQADSGEVAQQTFMHFVAHLLEPLAHPNELPAELLNNRGEYRWGRSALMQRAGRKAAGSAASRHFATPSGDFAVIARKLTGVFTFISVLDAEFNGYELLEPYLGSAARQAS